MNFAFTKKIVTTAALLFVVTHAPIATATHGIAWKNDKAKLFDVFLRTNPVVLYRVHKSSKTIQETLATLKTAMHHKNTPQEEAVFVKAQLDQTLVLVKPFIDDIRGYKDLVVPLLSESYSSHSIGHTTLKKFLDGNESLEIFVTKEVKTIESLSNLLLEIQAFFADLFTSLSKETVTSYKAFITEQSKKQS